jgi:hypothetical protein
VNRSIIESRCLLSEELSDQKQVDRPGFPLLPARNSAADGAEIIGSTSLSNVWQCQREDECSLQGIPEFR